MNDEDITNAIQGDKTLCPLCPHPLSGHFTTTGHCAAMKCNCLGAKVEEMMQLSFQCISRTTRHGDDSVQCILPMSDHTLHIYPDNAQKKHNTYSSVLKEAHAIINGERQKDYGSPLTSFTTIAALWSVVLDIEVTAEQVALCMIQLKVARAKNGGMQRDSLVDIAGYAGCIELMEKERNNL